MPSLANQVLPELHMSQIKHTFSDGQGHVFEPFLWFPPAEGWYVDFKTPPDRGNLRNVYSLFELEIKVISLKHLILGQILWHGNYYTVKGNHTSSQRETEAIIMLLSESKRCSCFLVNTVLFFCVTCKLSQNLRKLTILTSLLSYLQCSYSVTSLCIWIANITVCRSWLLSRTVYETHLREEASLAFTLLPNKWPVAERLIKDEKAIFSKFWNKASIV